MDKWVSNYKKTMLSGFPTLDWGSREPVYSQVPHKPSLLRFSALSSQGFTRWAYFYLRESSIKSKHTKRNTNPNGHSVFLPQDICCSWTLSPLHDFCACFLALQTKCTKINAWLLLVIKCSTSRDTWNSRKPQQSILEQLMVKSYRKEIREIELSWKTISHASAVK